MRYGLCIQDYKSLCTPDMICATLVVPMSFVHFDPCDPEKYVKFQAVLVSCLQR